MWVAGAVEGRGGQLELWRGSMGSWNCGGMKWAPGNVDDLDGQLRRVVIVSPCL